MAEWRFLRQHFYRVLAAADLPRMRFHDLRHSAATLLKEMGVDDVTVSRILGHSSPAITMKLYGHVTAALQQQAADRMDGVMTVGARTTTSGNIGLGGRRDGSQMAARTRPASGA